LNRQYLFSARNRCEGINRVHLLLHVEDLDLSGSRWIAHGNAEEEPVELRLRKRERPFVFNRILRRHNHERLRHLMRIAVDGDLSLFHHFQQRRLSLWRGAVNFIGENDLREDWPWAELKIASLLVVNGDASDVCRKHVWRELDALERAPDGLCQ